MSNEVSEQPYALCAKGIVKSFKEAGEPVEVLKGVDLNLSRGEAVAVLGSSGSGKSTLLHILGGLDSMDGGSVFIDGQNLSKCSEKEICAIRNRKMGFVYQFHHLLPELSALENVAMPLLISRENERAALEKARQILNEMGLGARLRHFPAQLSGGERQRVAISRALVAGPCVVLADEPTGNLDSQSARMVFDMFLRLAHKKNAALLIVTHDAYLARSCDRTLCLKEGKLKDAD